MTEHELNHRIAIETEMAADKARAEQKAVDEAEREARRKEKASTDGAVIMGKSAVRKPGRGGMRPPGSVVVRPGMRRGGRGL